MSVNLGRIVQQMAKTLGQMERTLERLDKAVSVASRGPGGLLRPSRPLRKALRGVARPSRPSSRLVVKAKKRRISKIAGA
jgi:hypothetical protein